MTEPFRVPRVKVCGLRRLADIEVAVEAGVEALGFVHHPGSPRSVEGYQVAELARGLPESVLVVGVMLSPSPWEARVFAEQARLGALQLCGGAEVQEWLDFPLPILRRLPACQPAAGEIERWSECASAFVLDYPRGPGGAGPPEDPVPCLRLVRQAPCILTGDLSGLTVRRAIEVLGPAGVDASSRLDDWPGRKNPVSVRLFVQAALAAFEARGG